MKSSKYTQASSPNDNEFRDYQNIGITRISDDGNQNNERIPYIEGHCLDVNNSSELLLKTNCDVLKTEEVLHDIQHFSPERNANRVLPPGPDIEMVCNCAIKNVVYAPKARYKDHYNSEQNVAMNRSFTSLPKLETTNLNQYSLDRKTGKYQMRQKHSYACEQNRKMLLRVDRNATVKRIQSPEIINIHRGPSGVFQDNYGADNSAIKSGVYDKELKCDDYGFVRGQSFRSTSARSNVSHSHPKRRPAGDGMDAEMDDPELMFELTEHLGDCQCACDHVVYTPGYTTCLQLLGPANIEIVSTEDCPCIRDNSLKLNIEEYKINQVHHIKANLTIATRIDEDVMIMLKGIASEEYPFQEERTYINHKSICRIIDNYLHEHYYANNMSVAARDPACPISPGYYEISDMSPLLSEINLPYEMLGHRKFRIELTKHDELLACKIFHLKNTADVILDLYKIYEFDSM